MATRNVVGAGPNAEVTWSHSHGEDASLLTRQNYLCEFMRRLRCCGSVRIHTYVYVRFSDYVVLAAAQVGVPERDNVICCRRFDTGV